MKKLISLILALILAISLVACTDKKGDNPDDDISGGIPGIPEGGIQLPTLPMD